MHAKDLVLSAASVWQSRRMQTGSGLSIKGELSATEDITIDGIFEGSIDLPKHRLVAAKGSRVNASVTALAVTVDGRLEGHITAESVDIGPHATVDASVITGKLALEEGATFNGAVNTERARAAATIAKHRTTGAARGGPGRTQKPPNEKGATPKGRASPEPEGPFLTSAARNDGCRRRHRRSRRCHGRHHHHRIRRRRPPFSGGLR